MVLNISKKYTAEYFKKIEYSDNIFNKNLINFLSKYKSNGCFLDLGCAQGYLLKYAEKKYRCYGLDISKSAIFKARKITKNSKLYLGNIEKDLDKIFGRKKFDIVVCLDVLEHLKHPDKVIKKISLILKPKGIFIFRIPNRSCIKMKMLSLINLEEKWIGFTDKTHISVFSLKQWKNLISENGLKITLLPTIPGKSIKYYISKHFQKMFFISPRLYFLNDFITVVTFK